MTYTFVPSITKEEFSEYTRAFSGAPIFQTPAWAKVKSNWKAVYMGVKDSADTLVGASMMLIRRIAPGFAFGYCPRGPLMDISNAELLSVFTEGVKKYAKNQGLCYVKIDPFIPVNVTDPELKGCQYIDLYSDKIDLYKAAADNLNEAGYIHKGFGKVLSDYIQPRYNAIVPLKNADGTPLTSAQLRLNYRPSIRKYTGQFAENRGIFTEITDMTDEALTEFARLIHSTEERQGIYLRGKDYFRLLIDAFGDDAKVFFAKCNVPVYKQYLDSRLKNEPENEAKIRELIAEADAVIAQKGEIVNLAGKLIVFTPNTEGVKIAEDLYTGVDLSVFSAFHITVSCLFDSMNYCIERGCDALNLGGVEGTLDDGLFEFKSKFCPYVVEYYGEYDLIVSPFRYKIIEKYLPTAVRIYKKIFRKLTGTENKGSAK